MPSLSIKDVPESIVSALRGRAARNHRSLQGELLDLITRAVAEPEGASPGPLRFSVSEPTPAAHRSTGVRKTIEQIASEHLERFPTPVTGSPRSVDLIRRARDARQGRERP